MDELAHKMPFLLQNGERALFYDGAVLFGRVKMNG
jgi:hypothetical protein|tara:strand:- start:495 stop:599 length:105 start_codon:yes stop_codon:yes gene_type:complete